MALLNSLWRSTLVPPTAVSHTVFLNEDKFLKSLGLRGKFFISLHRSALTGPRFPGQAAVGGDAKVPSLLYYDQTGNVRAAGAEVLAENMLEAALTEGWTKAEWLVVERRQDIRRTHEKSRWKLHLRPKHLASSINSSDDLPPLPPENLPSTFSQISSNISSTAPKPIFRNIISHSPGHPSRIPSSIFSHIQTAGRVYNNSYTVGRLSVPASSPVHPRDDPVSTC
jgi:hypothetical protein